jgi:hypothetical protein
MKEISGLCAARKEGRMAMIDVTVNVSERCL